MELLVRAFPILPGKEGQLRQFARDLQTTRAAEAAEFYSRMGVAHESWHEQQQPDGLWVIAVTQFAGKPMQVAAQEYVTSKHGFDSWFKESVMLVTGINPDTTPLGPPTTCVFHTHGSSGLALSAAQ
jgi:hypothetical protein